MSLVGVGLDLVDIERFQKVYGGVDDAPLARCFTPGELQSAGVGLDRLTRLAGHFAVKEAALKVIGGLQDGIALTDLTVTSNGASSPRLELSGGALAAAAKFRVSEWHISITHIAGIAAAVAVAERADASLAGS